MKIILKAYTLITIIFSGLILANSTLEEYCLNAGGNVHEMSVIYSTNSGKVKGLSQQFCNFHKNGGTLDIGLETFADPRPSIAATLIKTLPEVKSDSSLYNGPYSNPSHNVCKNLGGTMVGFVVYGSYTSSQGESDICVFGDGSMVSGWTLIYMANHRSGYDEIKNLVKSPPLINIINA